MADKKKLGYTDTPYIKDQPWRVHDDARPLPPVVTPGTFSSQEAAGTAPSDAIVLFDGSNLDAWEAVKGGDAAWDLVDGGAMQVKPGTGGIRTRQKFGDVQLHIEWAAPAEIKGASQGRGNSGVFLQSDYEVQVLDGYDNPTYADGLTGAVYGVRPPLVNACSRPGQWHIYDIAWKAPRFNGTELVSPAVITVFHNGVLIHHALELPGPTGHRDVYSYKAHAEKPLELQDHGDLVRFRNIWIRQLKDYDEA